MKRRDFALMKRMVLRRLDGITYLNRIRLVQTPCFAVYLHRFDGPDPRPELHDHPWPFVTMVIKGGYHELRKTIGREQTTHMEHRRAWRPRVMRLTEAHTIVMLDKAGTRSIVVCGRRQREWGFYTEFGTGWKHYMDMDTKLKVVD